MNKRIIMIFTIFVMTANLSVAFEKPGYYERNDFLMTSPGSFYEGLLGFSNPANLAFQSGSEHRFYWSSDGVNASSFGNWGYFFGTRGFGFGMQRQEFGTMHVTDYRLSTGFGYPDKMFGIGYSWTSGDKKFFGRERLLTVGTLHRPCRYISGGLIGNFSMESGWNEGILELGVRPLGDSRITIFADGALQKDMRFSDAPWSTGAAVQIIPGTFVVGRYFESKAFTIGFFINLGLGGFGARTHYNIDQRLSRYTYTVRAGNMRPSFMHYLIDKEKRYAAINMKGDVEYLKYVAFDEGVVRLMDVLRDIRAAYRDPRIGVIALNLSGMRIRSEHAWEIRDELRKARLIGKRVVIFLDNTGMNGYHLASVADKIVMEPEGSIRLGGYVMGRTYFKGTLEKLGLGFDEWRFFKYKSAAEVLSRDSMSDPDREQNQAYVDDLYEYVRDDICTSRGLPMPLYENLINMEAFFTGELALETGLVDTLARWSDKDNVIKSLFKAQYRGIPRSRLLDNGLPQDNWGQNPVIAVVYGLGECAMDSGIRARWLERVFLNLEKNKKVKAVVFRVDSPGGEGMASDLVAEALRKCSQKKPVIVSQGQVAGSGGYWISMYGNKILAGPSTITGSIGVYGGWIYDKGLGDKLGMTSDFVKRGEHADLLFGITLPYAGLRIPARNLTDYEHAKMEKIIQGFYDDFVGKVAIGRNMSIDFVREIAQGHFYSGIDGKELGLVDDIGGIMAAIALARSTAEILPDEEVQIIEIPKNKGLFKIKSFMPSPAFDVKQDPVYKYLKIATENPGAPLPMLIPGTYPEKE
ncbi:MAG: S49 family peptidase [Candidatus Zixiibacteriota bacterium]